MISLEKQSATAAHWAESSYHTLFKDGAGRIALVAQDGDKVAGFLIARIAADECELENIVVEAGRQRNGIGCSLIQALMDSVCKTNEVRIFLEVRESNAAARKLYEKCGFQIAGRRTSYYHDPAEDAVAYVRVPQKRAI